MIKFFRRIRYDLIGTKKTGKYMIYAVGEIVLVVIGILIALQINTWNQDKQNRSQEQLLLKQLLVEYQSNYKQINNKIFLRDGGINSALRLLSFRNLSGQEIPSDSVSRDLSRLILRPTFDPELGVSTELINSGKLYIITNEELRNRISAFPSSLSELREEEMAIFKLVEEKFIPFLIENFQVGSIMAEFLDDREIRKRVSIGESREGKSIKDLFTQSAPEKLLNHPDFEDYISILISNTTYTNDQSYGIKKKIEELILLIEKAIKE
jgi:hypothetical protein